MKNNRCNKISGVVTLVCCLLLSMFPITVFANPDSESLMQEVQGDEIILSIPEDAIILSTPEDVCTLAENCRVSSWSVGKTVVLKNDIDMSETDFQGVPTFGGVFLGLGNKISGISFIKDGSVVGFFRYVQKSALVNGLEIEGVVQPEGSKSVGGGIAGNNEGTISFCTVDGIISGYEKIGGIAGVNESGGIVLNCFATGVIYGNHFVGGIVGENHGVIRNCTNQAEINTQSVQNSVSIEDITMDSMLNTERADTTTDIGGIAGISSGVIRDCTNSGAIGYQRMGYNIGGIAGTQNGYILDCVNKADIQGRKEVGGIVGHMEPNIVLNFTEDSLQVLSDQMDSLASSINGLKGSIEDSGEDINNQIEALGGNAENVQNAIDTLQDSLTVDSGTIESNLGELDVESGNIEETIDSIEAGEVETGLDKDRIIAATNDLGDSLNSVYEESNNIKQSAEAAVNDISNQMGNLSSQLEGIQSTVNDLEEGINMELKDISDEDTDEDTIGKISNCTNEGAVSGDMNIGGIAGIMAEENDLDEASDTSVYGNVSLNISGEARAVIRDCINTGTISANKLYAGGIAGCMMLGAVLESVNIGSMDALSADYVGGIAGSSDSTIRECGSKTILAGDSYVGGIAGQGNAVTGCYTFVRVDAYTEKAGAILGYTRELPDGDEDTIYGNYYYISGENVGGIDGISYTGATDEMDLAGFLQMENLDNVFKTANICFEAEGQDDIVLTVNVGESLSYDELPTLEVEEDSEYDWEYIPNVTSETLSVDETATVKYVSEELLTNILFDQTYKAVYELKNTVIRTAECNDNNLAFVLAEGCFEKNDTLKMVDELSNQASINEKDFLVNWNIHISNQGVRKLHYLIPEEVNTSALELYVKDASGNWAEREFIVDGSYMIFDFTDGEIGFALVEGADNNLEPVILIAAGLMVIVLGIILLRKSRK